MNPTSTRLLLVIFLATATLCRAQLLWTVGLDDNGWPTGTLGGPEASFVQEGGGQTALPGSPFSTSVSGGADNDYYFAGDYSTVIESVTAAYGVYDPVGVVDFGAGVAGEEAAERAFAGTDLEQRYHFNLPNTLKPTDLLAVTYDMYNLDESGTDSRFGVEVWVNGVKVQDQIVIRPPQINIDYTTPAFTLASVNAQVGPGFDNIVALRGISYNAEGGGNWMGIDYVQLDQVNTALPVPVFPWRVGNDDNGWPVGNGGGTNATFVDGNGTVNALPGSFTSTETAGGADNDYYFAGLYTNVIAANGTYTPVGLVSTNEEAAERGFTATETELRYHFNLPTSLQASDLVAVTFDALSLDTNVANPQYGVEVYVNGVRVQTEVVIGAAQVGQEIATQPFTLASVNAQTGLGADNIVRLVGISHAGGGSSLGLDYVRFKPVPPLPVVPWSVGRNDNGNPAGDGGGPNASFVQENFGTNALPGNPNSPEADQGADDDYYWAGVYTTVLPGNGNYVPVGDVPRNEEAAERAFSGVDNYLRYHFNLPSSLSLDTPLTFSFDPLSLDEGATSGDAHYGVEVYVNGVKVMPEVVVHMDQLNRTIFTPPFTPAQVNAQVGTGPDNIITLKGINYDTAEGGGNWMGFDYVRLDRVQPAPWPLDAQTDNNSHSGGAGGGPNANFVQEAGTNPLPGSPSSGEVDQRSDDDYYFAGVYSNTIPGVVAFYEDYQPVGTVLVNEYAGERAFAGSDNEKRFHFNLPSTLQPTDQLVLNYDMLDLQFDQPDPQYGVEVYFNGVQVQPEIIVRGLTVAELDTQDFTVGPFTLASVDAKTGPGYDNVLTLRGINHSGDGGGGWMGIDYVQVSPMPKPVFPIQIGMDDNGWPTGDGGGPNATFVQENGVVNDLPGSPRNREQNQQADNDYYMAGVYSNVITDNGFYDPVGIVARNEEAAERAFVPANPELRYHFNLPSTLSLNDQVAVTFDAVNLDERGTDARWGVEVYFNNVLVQPEIIIRTNQLDVDYTSPAFTLASVKAQLGNADNIVTLKGISYSAEGGGDWMGIDYVRIHAAGDTGQPLEFSSATVTNGKITISWDGTGNLEWAPLLTGPWTPVTPSPTSPYTEDVQANQPSRFYRLKKP